MMDYEAAWKTLENRERAINEELRQPGISAERRNFLEAEKRKVDICKRKLIEARKSDGGRDRTEDRGVANIQKDSSEANENKQDENNLEQVQQRQIKQAREHQRDLINQKHMERQRG